MVKSIKYWRKYGKVFKNLFFIGLSGSIVSGLNLLRIINLPYNIDLAAKVLSLIMFTFGGFGYLCLWILKEREKKIIFLPKKRK